MEYTIVIPVYNKEEFLYRAMLSATLQNIPPSTILVLDDASTDQSLFQLEPFLNKPIDLRIIQMKKNVGISKLLNQGLNYINTPYFIQLDGDDWLEPHAAERLVNGLEQNPDAAFAFGNHNLWKYNASYQLECFGQVIQPLYKNKYDFLLKLSYMLNPRCYRTECVKQVGGWVTDDPWEGRYMEDCRMVIRLLSNYSWVQIQEILHNVFIDQFRSDRKIPMYNYIRKKFYETMLKEWGDQYRPVWETASTGRIVLKKLRLKNK